MMGPEQRASQTLLADGVGVMVVGHGTADPVGVAETRQVTEHAARMLPGVPVTLGFLEVCGPTISEAMDVLANAGCREVMVAPLLLFEAGHAKRDIPEAICEAARGRGISVMQAAPLGCHPEIVTLAVRRRAEAMAAAGAVPAEETTLVMVGRGSSDPAAVDQLVTFTKATLPDTDSFARVVFGFVAAARPTLAEAIQEASDPPTPGVRMVMVQPHLLFRGHVEEQVVAAIDAGRARKPDLTWVPVPRLGADPLVAKALVARALERAAEVGLKTVSPNTA
jgi:sirohydrochlorin cobaltochelatase